MLKTYVAARTRLMELKDRLAALRDDDSGAAMIEYALIVGLIAVVAATAVSSLGTKIQTEFQSITNQMH